MPRLKKRRSPSVGSKYTKRFKGKLYEMVVSRVGGGIGYSVSGKTYKSPSAAAKSITKMEVNGWRFWKIN